MSWALCDRSGHFPSQDNPKKLVLPSHAILQADFASSLATPATTLGGERGRQEFTAPAITRGQAILTSRRVQTDMSRCLICKILPAIEPPSSATETSTAAWGALQRRRSGPVEELEILLRSSQECAEVRKAPRVILFPLPNPLVSPVTSRLGVVCRLS